MFEFPWFWIMFFVIFFGCGRMCGWGARRYVKRRRRHEDEDEVSYMSASDSSAERLKARGDESFLAAGGYGRLGDKQKRDPVRLKARGTPLEQLQRKFVDGRITLDEYERQVDQLERL